MILVTVTSKSTLISVCRTAFYTVGGTQLINGGVIYPGPFLLRKLPGGAMWSMSPCLVGWSMWRKHILWGNRAFLSCPPILPPILPPGKVGPSCFPSSCHCHPFHSPFIEGEESDRQADRPGNARVDSPVAERAADQVPSGGLRGKGGYWMEAVGGVVQ